MTTPVGAAVQGNVNIAGAPYAAWNNSAGTGLIGPTGGIVPIGPLGAIYDGTNSISTGTAVFSASNGVSFGIAGQTITASISRPVVSNYVPIWPASTSTVLINALGASSNNAVFFPCPVVDYVAFDMVAMLQSYSYVTSSSAASLTQAVQFGIFSNNASTWSLISSGSSSLAMTNSGVSGTISYATATATSGYGYSTVGFSSTATGESLFGNYGYRNPYMQFGGSMSLSPGLYAIGMLSTASSSSANVGINQMLVGNVIPISSMFNPGQSTTAVQDMLGMGYGTASTASLPVSMAFSNMTNSLGIIPIFTIAST